MPFRSQHAQKPLNARSTRAFFRHASRTLSPVSVLFKLVLTSSQAHFDLASIAAHTSSAAYRVFRLVSVFYVRETIVMCLPKEALKRTPRSPYRRHLSEVSVRLIALCFGRQYYLHISSMNSKSRSIINIFEYQSKIVFPIVRHFTIKFLLQMPKLRLSRHVIKGPRVNLNQYWSKFEEMHQMQLPLVELQPVIPNLSLDEDINEILLAEFKDFGK